MPSKNYTLFFILSVAFVLVSIAFITIIGQTNSRNSGSDIRAKATVQNSLQLLGTVSSVHSSDQTLVIDNVRFVNNDSTGTMGTFTGVAGEDVSFSQIKQGMNILMSVDAGTFSVGEKTFTVLAVSPQ